MPTSPPPTASAAGPRRGLAPEFFQLVQAAVYHADGMWGEATFDLYVKEAPPDHGYLVAAGIEPAVQAVLDTRFTSAFTAWLQQQPQLQGIGPRFFEDLAELRFEGDIHAVPEGTVVFPGQPILRLSAPLPQAGLFEAGLIQLVSQATGVATRAARMVTAARGRPVLDFGSRRSPGPEAAWAVARAAYIGGVAATTNTLAAADLGIPAVGVVGDTIAAAYGGHAAAWEALRLHAPRALDLQRPHGDAVPAVRLLGQLGEDLRAVRVDDGDLLGACTALRRALDHSGQRRTRILGSGGLDEVAIDQLLRAGAPIDELGVGAALAEAPAPATSFRIAERVSGLQPEPVTGPWASPWPGRKSVVRLADHDVICEEIEAEVIAAGTGQVLLQPWVRAGRRVRPVEALAELRARRAAQVQALPEGVRRLLDPEPYRVIPSERLLKLRQAGG